MELWDSAVEQAIQWREFRNINMWPGGRWREWNVSDTGHDVFTGNLNQGGLAAVCDISSQVTKWGVAVTQLQLVEGLVYCGKGVEFMGHKGAGCLDLVYCGKGEGVDSPVLELMGHKGAVLDMVIVVTARVLDIRAMGVYFFEKSLSFQSPFYALFLKF